MCGKTAATGSRRSCDPGWASRCGSAALLRRRRSGRPQLIRVRKAHMASRACVAARAIIAHSERVGTKVQARLRAAHRPMVITRTCPSIFHSDRDTAGLAVEADVGVSFADVPGRRYRPAGALPKSLVRIDQILRGRGGLTLYGDLSER